MTIFHKISSGKGNVINVIVEIPMGCRNKYELDKETGAIFLDRVLYSPFFYPCDYGIMAQSWYDDGDPLDVMVYTRSHTFPGCVVEARAIGLLRMKDEKGADDKILSVPTKDPKFKRMEGLDDIPEAYLEEVAHFFQRYKELEKGKFSEVVGWFGKKEASGVIEKARELYKKKFSNVK